MGGIAERQAGRQAGRRGRGRIVGERNIEEGWLLGSQQGASELLRGPCSRDRQGERQRDRVRKGAKSMGIRGPLMGPALCLLSHMYPASALTYALPLPPLRPSPPSPAPCLPLTEVVPPHCSPGCLCPVFPSPLPTRMPVPCLPLTPPHQDACALSSPHPSLPGCLCPVFPSPLPTRMPAGASSTSPPRVQWLRGRNTPPVEKLDVAVDLTKVE